jgi:beta-lactamase superfamily II metal-dependent hydrolase
MEVKFLKAGKGDCILIKSNGANMLIDGGDDSTYLLKELDIIYNDRQCLDILAITHHDSDHIKGIIDFLIELENKRFGEPIDFVKRVFFNSPRLIKGIPIPKDSKFLSFEQASDVERIISKLGLVWDTIILDSTAPLTLGNVRLTCLSPNEKIVDGYANARGAKLSPDERSDWDKNLVYLEKYIEDRSIDNSISNQSSIVFSLECNGKRGLLTGDITPKRFEKIISKLYADNENNLISFDFIKLPHHGSHRNLTKEIVSKINCTNYLVSTDGNNHYLPDKMALLKVVKYQATNKKSISFLFNYSETLEKLRITNNEKKKYNIELKPNNSPNGYCISTI